MTTSEHMRKLIDMAVSAGRKRQSSQTGFVHYHYHEEEPYRTIPIYENLLFALALFRSRTVENVEEAKVLLERLLHFQNALKDSRAGNFPVYLHEFPDCRDRYQGVHLLIPLYWISAHFHHILGNGLRQRFEEGVRSLLRYCLETDSESPMPPAVALKLAAAAKAFGDLWQDTSLQTRGEERLKSIDASSWKTPIQLSEVLPALQMIVSRLEGSHWNSIWEWLDATWHRNLLAYVGPAWCEWQEGSQTQATLYDLYMGYLSGAFSGRALLDQIIHLQAALIQPTDEKLPQVSYPRKSSGYVQEARVALATIDQASEWPRATDRSFHRLRASWGIPKQLHTLVCQGGNIVQCSFEPQQMVCTLGAQPPDGEREKCREIAFYLNIEAAQKILVGDIAATTFRLGESITIQSDPVTIRLSFQLQSGTGDFIGHIMRGNRPAQLALKGSNRYQAYDWQIFLRTLRRSDECRILTTIEIEEKLDVTSA